MIGIIDYGAGNLGSVSQIFERAGTDIIILSNPSELKNQDVRGLVLPGVGSFKIASENLRSLGWYQFLNTYSQSGGKLLGICLGMQLLFDVGTEDGVSKGLGLIPGKVENLPSESVERIPHTGWNTANWQKDHPITEGVRTGLDFYHVHSYHCLPSHKAHILSFTDYGIQIVNAVSCENIVGLQFHPEKSQPIGQKLIKNFIDWAYTC